MAVSRLPLSLALLLLGGAGCSNALGSEDRGFAPTPDADTTIPTQSVVINEIAADGKPDDWLELYNGTDEAVDLSLLRLSTDPTDPRLEVFFPEGSVVESGGYFVQFLDSDLGLELDDAGELVLIAPDGLFIDRVEWLEGDSPKELSYGRLPDVLGDFVTFEDSTRGYPNGSF